MPNCGNRERRKNTASNGSNSKLYSAQDWLELHGIGSRGSGTTDPSIEAVLKFMGIEKRNFTKDVAYRHWEKFIEFVKHNSGKSWHNFIRPRLRSYVSIDYRYLDDFLESCLSWGIMKLVNGNLTFIGIPEEGAQG